MGKRRGKQVDDVVVNRPADGEIQSPGKPHEHGTGLPPTAPASEWAQAKPGMFGTRPTKLRSYLSRWSQERTTTHAERFQ